MSHVTKATVDEYLEILKARYENLVVLLTTEDGVNEVEVFYNIDLQKMNLAKEDLKSVLKLLQIG